jgi:hypothetical protein
MTMAMDVDQCPRESRTLQPNYTSKKKIKAFSHDGACWRAVDTTSCASLPATNEEKNLPIPILLCALRDSHRHARNTDKIWVFDTRDISLTIAASTFARQIARSKRLCCTARNAPLSL